MKEINCILCGVKNDRVAIEEGGFTGRRCESCGLIYISPRPSMEEIIELYGHDGAHIPAELHISAEFGKRLIAKHHLRIMESVLGTGALLEIGAGAGYFLDEARKHGYTPFAIELNSLQARFVREELRIICEEDPLGPGSFGGRKFDVIFHCDVTSHFFEPVDEFKQMAASLKEGGLLIFETGNIADVDPKFFSAIESFQYPDHLFFFGERSIAALLERAGFEVLTVYHYSILPQLRFIEFLRGLRRILRPERPGGGLGAAGDSELSGGRPGLMRKVWEWFRFQLCYGIGRWTAKRGRPQTQILVARKKFSVVGTEKI